MSSTALDLRNLTTLSRGEKLSNLLISRDRIWVSKNKLQDVILCKSTNDLKIMLNQSIFKNAFNTFNSFIVLLNNTRV